MSNKDKKILALMSGGFLTVLALVLFVTIQSRDNLISNTGRVRGMEVQLGDAAGGIANCSESKWSCPDGSKPYNDECHTYANVSEPICLESNGTYSGDICYFSTTKNKEWTCKTCDNGYEPSGSGTTCVATCKNSGIYLENGTCHTCEKGWYCPENDSYKYDCGMPSRTTVGTGSTSEDDCICADGYHLMNDGVSCEKDSAYASLTCQTRVYNGHDQIIAICTNCTINASSNNAYARYNDNRVAYIVGVDNDDEIVPLNEDKTYTVNATADSGYEFYTSSSNTPKTSASCTATILKSSGGTQDETSCCYKDGDTYKYGIVDDENSCIKNVFGSNIDEHTCLNKNVSVCCYKDGDVYKYGSVANAASCVNDNTITNETQCLAKNTTTCCYKTFSGYVYGETNINNCDHDSLSITNAADCTAKNNRCDVISVSTTSKAVSIDNDPTSTNSYYTVNVTVSGYGCSGKKLNYTATNAKSISPESETISSSTYAGAATYSYNVYPEKACQESTAKVEVLDGSTVVTSSKTVTINVNNVRTDWKSTDVCIANPPVAYRSVSQADEAGANVYYSDYTQCTLNGTNTFGYTKKWERNSCDTSGGGEPDGEYCWVKKGTNGNTNEYTYGTKPGSGWEKYGDTCPITACYYNPTTGVYTWTNSPSYDNIWITSIDNKNDCETPNGDYSCYINTTTNDYKWAVESPGEGYEKNSTINTPSACAPPESPACYENLTTGNREWGLYSSVIGYNYISNNKNDCPEKIPDVPPTATNISTIIYVSMAIFGSVGIGFIVYSNYRKEKI